MSRLSQYISFINAEKAPSGLDMKHHYNNIDKTPQLMLLRKEHQKRIKNSEHTKKKSNERTHT